MYPISVLFDGYALNVTIVGYHDRLAIGFTGCRDALPSLQRLAMYSVESLEELEHAIGTRPRAPQPASPKRAEPKRLAKPTAKKRSEEHTSELQSLMRISYAVFCLKNKNSEFEGHNDEYNYVREL